MPHAIPPEGLPAAGKKFTLFLSVLLPQVIAEGNGKVKTFSLGFLAMKVSQALLESEFEGVLCRMSFKAQRLMVP